MSHPTWVVEITSSAGSSVPLISAEQTSSIFPHWSAMLTLRPTIPIQFTEYSVLYDQFSEIQRQQALAIIENKPIVPNQERVFEMKDKPQDYFTINQLQEGLQDSLKAEEEERLLALHKPFVDEAKTKVLSIWDSYKIENPKTKNRHTKDFVNKLLWSRDTIFANAFNNLLCFFFQKDRTVFVEIKVGPNINQYLIINTKTWTCKLVNRSAFDYST